MAVSEALLRYGNAHWDNLTFQSRMIFLDAYMGEMNYPLMIYEGAIKMPETIQEVSRLQGWSNEETIYTLMDFSKGMGWITKDAFDMMMMASESDAYTYAYNEGHSDSRKNEGYQPTMENQKEETRFRKILRQRAETFNAYNQQSHIQNLIDDLYDDGEIALNKLLKINNPSLQNLISKNALLRDKVGGLTLAEWSQVQNQLKYTPSGRIRTFGSETFAGEESWQSGVREYFGDEDMMDFYDWMQDNYKDDDDDFIEYDDPEEWRDRVHRYFGDEEMMDFYDWLKDSDWNDEEEFGAMMMPKRYLMICPECDETVPEMDNCVICEADLTVTEAPMVEVVDLEAEEGNFFSEVLIGGLCVFAVSFLLGREAHRRIKG